MKIIADSHIPFVKEYFGSYGELILKPGRSISAADVKDADILLVRSVTPVNENLLADSKVKFVGSVTAGADHLDTEWLDRAGILWSIASGFNAPPVADYVVSMIAALQKKQILLKKPLKAAVIGVGHVGRLIVEKLRVLNFDIILSDPIRASSEKDFLSIDLKAISDCDLISIHVPLTKTGDYPTYHFIGKEFLKQQKPGCVLINASRGAVLNSDDFLNHGDHLHGCFDVWEHEPKINKKVLEKALIATPHIAGYSLQSKIRGIDMIYKTACKKNIIAAQTMSPISFPTQHLKFSGENLHWQEIVLGVFNPLVITAMMRTMLLPANDVGTLFDDMRHQFNYRHEFSATSIVDSNVNEKDLTVLSQLGFL